ncbi:MAG: hypothetical protein ACM3ZB_14815 [bacterium]
MAKAVIGYLPDIHSVDALVRELLDLGFSRNEIGVFTEPALGGELAGSELDSPGGKTAGLTTESAFGMDKYTMRNAPILVQVTSSNERVERAAELFRKRGARDVEVRRAHLAPVKPSSLAATGRSAARHHMASGSRKSPPVRPRKPV